MMAEAPKKAFSRPRPIRAAFLVEQHEHENAMLDAIFQNCMGRWGGRFSLVIPSGKDGPNKEYMNWLEAYDPDIIYSYVDLDENIIRELHEQLYPSFLVKHHIYSKDHDVRAFSPDLPIKGLQVTSVIPLITLPSILNNSRNGKFLEAQGKLENTTFIKDSFGFFMDSLRCSYPPTMREYGSTVTLLTDEECQPRQRYGLQNEETISSVENFIRCHQP